MTLNRGAARAGVFLVTALVLFGCADAVRTYNFQQYHDRWPELIAWQTSQPIEIMVWGNPFNATQAALDAAVADSLSRQALRPGALLPVHSDGQVPNRPYVSIVFESGKRPFGYECTDLSNVNLNQPPAGEVEVHGAICRGGAPLSRIDGVAHNVTGPNDPAFHSLIGRIGERLFRAPAAL